MSSAPAADEIWRDARWLAQAVDPRAGLVRLVEMTPENYRDASFLDDRMFEQPRVSHLLPWNDVAGTMPANARADARWIFHIGHVGSTLIARLLGELAERSVGARAESVARPDILPAGREGSVRAGAAGLVLANVSAAIRRRCSRRRASSARLRRSLCRRMGEHCSSTRRRVRTFPAFSRGENSTAGACRNGRHTSSAPGIARPGSACSTKRSRPRGRCLGVRDDGAGNRVRTERPSGRTSTWSSPTWNGRSVRWRNSSGSPQLRSEWPRSPAGPSPAAIPRRRSMTIARNSGATCWPRRTSDIVPTSKARLPCSTAASETAPLLRKALDRAQAES